jgi:uncharacterized membrane protein YfcA
MEKDLALLLAGVVVGAMNAIAGGGMLVGFPVLLALGVPPLVANASTSLIVLPGNLAAIWGYRKYLRRIPIGYLLLVVPIVVGAIIGATMLRSTSADDFKRIVPELVLLAVALFAFQPFLYEYLRRHLHGSLRIRRRIKPVILVAIALLPVAVYGGFFGVGFGFIMLAFLGFTKLHDHIHRMTTLKNLSTTCLSITALLVLAGSGLIDWHIGAVMGAGTLAGGYIGSVYTQRISSHWLRIIIICIGVGAAAWLGLRDY